MPNRIIKESIKTSDNIDKLTWFEEVVFYRLLTTVDDYGCYDGRVIVLKNELFPTKENVTKKQVEEAILKLESVGLLVRYSANDLPYIYLPSWDSHQRVRNKHRKYPEPTEDNRLTANCGQVSASCQSESNPIQSESNPIRIQSESNGSRMKRPTVEEVQEYISMNNYAVNAERFVDYYESNGWKVGRNPMKDWKACVRTWHKKEQDNLNKQRQQKGVLPF